MPAQCIVWPDVALVPGQGVQVELLDLAVLEEGGQADPVVGEMLLLANDSYVVLAGAGVELEELFSWWMSETGASALCESAAGEAYMKAIPTIPRPTTTIFFLEPAAMVLKSRWRVAQQYVSGLSSGSCELPRVPARSGVLVSVMT